MNWVVFLLITGYSKVMQRQPKRNGAVGHLYFIDEFVVDRLLRYIYTYIMVIYVVQIELFDPVSLGMRYYIVF